jgi:hypothetical protein
MTRAPEATNIHPKRSGPCIREIIGRRMGGLWPKLRDFGRKGAMRGERTLGTAVREKGEFLDVWANAAVQ